MINNESRKMWLQAANVSYLGIFFGVAIVIGYLGGAYADRHLHTGPWLSVVGLLLAIAACIREVLRVTDSYRRQNRPPGGPATGGAAATGGPINDEARRGPTHPRVSEAVGTAVNDKP